MPPEKSTLPPTPPMHPPKPQPKPEDAFSDVYVHGYERTEHGKVEWVNAYWRKQPGVTAPLNEKKRKKILDYLGQERKMYADRQDQDHVDLEKYKSDLENSTDDGERKVLKQEIRLMTEAIDVDRHALSDIDGKISEVTGMAPHH